MTIASFLLARLLAARAHYDDIDIPGSVLVSASCSANLMHERASSLFEHRLRSDGGTRLVPDTRLPSCLLAVPETCFII